MWKNKQHKFYQMFSRLIHIAVHRNKNFLRVFSEVLVDANISTDTTTTIFIN